MNTHVKTITGPLDIGPHTLSRFGLASGAVVDAAMVGNLLAHEEREHARVIMAFWIAKLGPDNMTMLAENTANEMGHDEWLDDETHWIWDLAAEMVTP
jgi:hypothetical protein